MWQIFEREEAINLCLSRRGFVAIEEKKHQIKIYKNAMEMYRKKLKIKTSK
jgi:hypothetical protein